MNSYVDPVSPCRNFFKSVEDSGSAFSGTVPGQDHADLTKLAAALASFPKLAAAFASFPGDARIFRGVADRLPPLPGLTLAGVGIQLPLIDRKQAEGIKRMCKLHTKGSKRWQASADKVKLKNEEWQTGLEDTIKGLAERLRMPHASLTLRLSTLNFEEAGTSGQQSSVDVLEGAEEVLAHLILQLPSQYEGGPLDVRDASDFCPHRLHLDQPSGAKAYKVHYAVLPPGATAMYCPIASGYRISLHYLVCLARDHAGVLPAQGPLPIDYKPLSTCLGRLAKDRKEFDYFLEYEYSAASLRQLGALALTGTDRRRVIALCSANAALPPADQYTFELVDVERQISWMRVVHGRVPNISSLERVTESPQTEIVIRGRYQLDGGRVEGGPVDVRGVPEYTLNPDKKNLAELWHGRRRSEIEHPSGHVHFETYHKTILVARAPGDARLECAPDDLALANPPAKRARPSA